MTLTVTAAAPHTPARIRIGPAFAGIVTFCLGAAGVWIGLIGIFGEPRPLQIGWLLPLSDVDLTLDPIGGLFIAITGAVAIAVGI